MRDKQPLTHHGAYLLQLLRHKWLVLEEGRKLGVPLVQLLLHDLSKFLPDEWRAGVAFHRDGTSSAEALQKHYVRNRHHPQWWVQEGKAMPMPERFRLEMLADWRAMAREREGEVIDWYEMKGHTFPLHHDTRKWLESKLFSPVSAGNSISKRA